MFKHYLFTRWNLLDANTTIYNNPAVEDPEEWMEHRMKLFDELTLPSVICQTCTDFTWLLAFDRNTPEWIKDKYMSFPNVMIAYNYPADHIKNEYSAINVPPYNGDWIITSRLDNDDIILPEYIETVQSYFDKTFKLVDVNGYQYDLATGKHYDPDRAGCTSPFISLIEQVGTPWQSIGMGEVITGNPSEKKLIKDPVKTVYYCSHGKMEWHFPAVRSRKRLYKMVIHDRNISNKITGHEILQWNDL